MQIARHVIAAAAFATLMAVAAGDAVAQSDAERFTRLENSVRNLTGQVEELTFQVRTLQDQLRRLQQDVDFRFGEMGGAATGAVPQQGSLGGQSLDAGGGFASTQPLDDASTQLGQPPSSLGQIILDAPPADQPFDLSSAAGGGALDPFPAPQAAEAGQLQVASIAPTGNPTADYDQAYSMIMSGRYDLAESAFRQFLGAYPQSEMAPEAQYWLGESLFARGDFARAAEEFRAGYKAYPSSRRGPDTLLKLGLSLAGLGYRDEACQMYAATVRQYPDMSNALRQRVQNERASAGC